MSVDLFERMLGSWGGNCCTWFEPGKLADESGITGEIESVLGGRFLRHTYRATIQDKPRQGEELIGLNAVTNRYQVSWIDDFHMNSAIMFAEGGPIELGFSVLGNYDVAPGEPLWGWRTDYQLLDTDRLIITAYNVTPDGEVAKAVETRYQRSTH